MKAPDVLGRRLARSHRRARRGTPWLQGVTVAVVLPLLMVFARVRIVGRERLPEGGFIVAPNHPSVLDPFFAALPVLPRRMHFMGMSELWRKALPAWALTRMGGFPVVRGTWDRDAFETAASVLDRGRVLIMFPEGGVSPPGGYKPARSGLGHLAHLAGATVVPVHLAGPRSLYQPWRFPKIVITVGDPITVDRISDPPRETALATAERVLDAVKRLGP